MDTGSQTARSALWRMYTLCQDFLQRQADRQSDVCYVHPLHCALDDAVANFCSHLHVESCALITEGVYPVRVMLYNSGSQLETAVFHYIRADVVVTAVP